MALRLRLLGKVNRCHPKWPGIDSSLEFLARSGDSLRNLEFCRRILRKFIFPKILVHHCKGSIQEDSLSSMIMEIIISIILIKIARNSGPEVCQKFARIFKLSNSLNENAKLMPNL